MTVSLWFVRSIVTLNTTLWFLAMCHKELNSILAYFPQQVILLRGSYLLLEGVLSSRNVGNNEKMQTARSMLGAELDKPGYILKDHSYISTHPKRCVFFTNRGSVQGKTFPLIRFVDPFFLFFIFNEHNWIQ